MPRPREQPALRPLREHLLRGGVAPAHVERYMGELRDHLADLIAEQGAAGLRGEAAEREALERLGAPETLRHAILSSRDAISWSAKAPVVAYACAPVAGLVVLAALAMVALVLICRASSSGLPLYQPLPAWVAPFAAAATLSVNAAAPVLMGWLLGREAERRRVRPLWPLMGMALLAISPLARLVLAPPAVKGTPGELDIAFDLLADPGAVLAHVAINFAIIATPYLASRRLRTLRFRRAGLR